MSYDELPVRKASALLFCLRTVVVMSALNGSMSHADVVKPDYD